MIGHEPVNLQIKPTTLYSSPTGYGQGHGTLLNRTSEGLGEISTIRKPDRNSMPGRTSSSASDHSFN